MTGITNMLVGSNKAIVAQSYSAVVDLLNPATKTSYELGQNIFVVTLDVPDLWISAVESTSVQYTYVSDTQFISDVTTAGGALQIGYYKVSFLETQKVDITTKMDKANPTGTGYFSLNRQAGQSTDIGDYSVSAGNSNKAKGVSSVAMGMSNSATAEESVAFGKSNSSQGTASIAMGMSNTVTGEAAAAIGKNIMSTGEAAFASGSATQALERYSHAQNLGTIARDTQTVIGRYNLDTSTGSIAFIIGNGTENNRSNAFMIDFYGNIRTDGDVLNLDGTSKYKTSTTVASPLVANTEYNLGTQTTLSLTLPTTSSLGDWILVRFVSGTTATTLTVTNAIGDIPPVVTNKTYECYFTWNGSTYVCQYNAY